MSQEYFRKRSISDRLLVETLTRYLLIPEDAGEAVTLEEYLYVQKGKLHDWLKDPFMKNNVHDYLLENGVTPALVTLENYNPQSEYMVLRDPLWDIRFAQVDFAMDNVLTSPGKWTHAKNIVVESQREEMRVRSAETIINFVQQDSYNAQVVLYKIAGLYKNGRLEQEFESSFPKTSANLPYLQSISVSQQPLVDLNAFIFNHREELTTAYKERIADDIAEAAPTDSIDRILSNRQAQEDYYQFKDDPTFLEVLRNARIIEQEVYRKKKEGKGDVFSKIFDFIKDIIAKYKFLPDDR
ncbi:hypothetical protein LZD49_32255 [Dyadobacter sp. CY261]|uniref:hypothetical protein n=1 Tax=Dyadobacter sp. CY261 TaxID=2907203 RepID=UPI001F336126|nr:hypothetical protein [Dyadobacter sp. CY261]MCF0075200.1 hypothetical protein [Dyadobacter sp. CY261]